MEEKVMGRFSLEFVDRNLKDKYVEAWINYKLITFRFIILFNSVIPTFGIIFFNVFPLNIWQKILLSAASISSFLAIYLLFTKKFRKYLDFGLFSQYFGTVLIPIESFVLQKFEGNMRFFCIGMYIQLMICLMLLMRTPFKYNFFFIFFLQIYPPLRIYTSGPKEWLVGEFWIIPIAHFIILVGLNYFTEKQQKLDFFEKTKYQETLECFKTVVKHNFPISISVIDSNGNRIFSNDATETLFKKPISDVDLESDIKIFSEEIRDTIKFADSDGVPDNQIEFKTAIDSTMIKSEARENVHTYSGRLLNVFIEDGEPKPIDLLLVPIKWEGKDTVLLIISDNSAKKRIEYLKRLGNYKDKLLATVSHDLRTPLNGIIGMITMCEEHILDEEMKQYLQFTNQLSQLLLFMINDILDFSQSCKGLLRLTKKWTNLEVLIRDVVKIMEFQMQVKQLSICITECEDFHLMQTYTDPNRLKQILLNLLGNAVKFTPEKGHIELIIERACIAEKQSVIIRVKDSGIGIKKEDIPKLFRLFGKLEQSDSEINTSGVGLGLTISQNLVSLLCSPESDCRIEVQSEPNKGSTFSFPIIGVQIEHREELDFLPIPNEDKNSILTTCKIIRRVENEPNSDSNKRAHPPSRSILIVDDDPINIIVEKNYATSANFAIIDTVYNGLEGFKAVTNALANNSNYDYILMDCNMPIMDGFQATREIKKACLMRGVLPPNIIGVTANVSEDDRFQCIEAGMDFYLTKPLKKEELLSIFHIDLKR